MDDTVEILANYPDLDGILLGPTTGEGKRGPATTTSDAKLALMNNLLSSWTGRNSFSKIVYIRDSGTDIECLTEYGTVGIAISADTNSSLIETSNRGELMSNILALTQRCESLQSTRLKI
jgi:thiamine phosphate phosphatase / amino-HMP aminohydrolase